MAENNTNPEFWVQTEETECGQIIENTAESKNDAESIVFTDEVIVQKVT